MGCALGSERPVRLVGAGVRTAWAASEDCYALPSFIPGLRHVLPSIIQGGSPEPELGTPGSVRGGGNNGLPYRDSIQLPARLACHDGSRVLTEVEHGHHDGLAALLVGVNGKGKSHRPDPGGALPLAWRAATRDGGAARSGLTPHLAPCRSGRRRRSRARVVSRQRRGPMAQWRPPRFS